MSISKDTFLNALATFKALQDEVYSEVFSAGASGIVPAPLASDAVKFLRGDGQWATPTAIIGTTPSTVEGAMWLED